MSLQFGSCEMAKQKRKESRVAEKKSKNLKVSAAQTPPAPAAPPGAGTAPAEVGKAGMRLVSGGGQSPWTRTVPSRQLWERSELQGARSEPRGCPFSASKPRGAGGAPGVMGSQWPCGVPGDEAAWSWALSPSHGRGGLAWGSVCVQRLHQNVF